MALGVSGGIAAYKAPELVRGLDRAGVAVQVILTRNATRFVTPLTLETVSRRKVLVEPFELEGADTVRHIELTRAIDTFLVAPATANVLGKLARGIADDFLTTFYTAVTAPVVLAPAMNTRMWLHPAVQENVAILRGRGSIIVEPGTGWLAEGETGWGRLAEPDAIVAATLAAVRSSRQLEGKTIVVTAGPTRERIDPVRFLSNDSSGKMGYALAAAAGRRGAKVVLVSGPVDLPPPFGVELVRVDTSHEMRAAVHRVRRAAHALFMTAAVADYVPAAAPAKIKKTGGPLSLTLDEGPDILAEIGADKGSLLLVGFAAETDDVLEQAREKLSRKNLDFIVANDVSKPGIGIGSDQNAVTLLERSGAAHEIPRASKREIAEAILDRIFGAGG